MELYPLTCTSGSSSSSTTSMGFQTATTRSVIMELSILVYLPPLPAPSTPPIDKAEYYHLVVCYEFSKRIRVHTDRALAEHISDEAKNTFSFADPESMTDILVLVMPELKWKKEYPTVNVGVVTKVKNLKFQYKLYSKLLWWSSGLLFLVSQLYIGHP